MKPLFAFMFFLGCSSIGEAHIGSPNVFFDGRAGPYAIDAIIKPPAALPGAAEVTVQTQEGGIASISLVPVQWQAGREGSPAPILAERVPGATQLWSTQVWFLRPGSYVVEIRVTGPQGTGQAIVPVNVLGAPARRMSGGLRASLILFALLLFCGGLLIIRGLARDTLLSPGAYALPANAAVARGAAALAFLFLTVGLAAGALRWRNMDRAYNSQGMQKPEPVLASVIGETNRLLLRLEPRDRSLTASSWAQLVPDHGKLMHLFLLRQPGQDAFAHLHPLRADDHTFTLELPPLPAGDYQLYGEFTFENGLNQTVTSQISLPTPLATDMPAPVLASDSAGDVICGVSSLLANQPGQGLRDPDDSWHIEPPSSALRRQPSAGNISRSAFASSNGALVTSLMGGSSLVFENARAVAEGRDTALKFSVFTPDGREARLQPYMGMRAHAVVRRSDGSVFAHLHPSGSFSMASEQVFRARLDPAEPARQTIGISMPDSAPLHQVAFPFQFPKPGQYRIWVQVRMDGRVLTGVFDLSANGGAL